jgi:hypothetical protein
MVAARTVAEQVLMGQPWLFRPRANGRYEAIGPQGIPMQNRLRGDAWRRTAWHLISFCSRFNELQRGRHCNLGRLPATVLRGVNG